MARDTENEVGVLDEDTLVDAISSSIDSNDPDAEKKARAMADILVHLASMSQGTPDTDSDTEMGGERGGEGGERRIKSNVGKSYGPVNRLPVRRG